MVFLMCFCVFFKFNPYALSHVLYIIPIIPIYVPHMLLKFMPWVWPNYYYFVCHTFHLSSMLFPNSLTFYLIFLARIFPLLTYIDELYGNIIHYTNYLCIEDVKSCGATNQWGQSSSWKKLSYTLDVPITN